MKIPALVCAVGAIAIAPSSAFLSSLMNKVNPSLSKYAEAQEDLMLKIRLDIGQVEMKDGNTPVITGNRLGIDNMLLQLHGNESADPKHTRLPGADGPNPQLSSGPKSLVVVNGGSYVDLTGTRSMKLEHGAWEMIWRNNARAGALICGFNLAEEVKRNDAQIPQGRFYVTFPLWTSESLQDLRERKAIAEEKAAEAIERLENETRLMQETNNPLQKALHFRNACKAHEDIDYSGYNSYKRMPLERDMIHLEDDLHLCSLGTIWTKKDGFFGDHVLLGSASVTEGMREDGSAAAEKIQLLLRVSTHELRKIYLKNIACYTISLCLSVMDVVDSPISTCRPSDDPSQQRQCGIVLGSKKTTVFAIDPTTGKVQWKQDPQGSGGGRGFTTHPPPNKSSRGLTVLLQREDYAVRHLNTDGGGEVWKVELGRFSALDFDVDAHDRDEEDEMDEREDDHVVGGSRRGSAAAAANMSRKDKKTSPILGGTRKHGTLHENKEAHHESHFFHEDDFDEHSHFRGFPSVAFGEDGTTLMAADGISGELLWKVRVESVVAAVYGVGKESTWIPLEVIDEADVFTNGHSNPVRRHGSGLLGISSTSSSLDDTDSGGLIPYGESDQVHRLGRYESSIFVSSKFDPLGLDPSSFSEHEYEEQLPIDTDAELPLRPQTSGHADGFSPAGLLDGITPRQSHSTEHGLYLTWSIVYWIIAVLVAVMILVRTKYVRQKRKWENTPSLDPTRVPSGSGSGESGRDRSLNSDGIVLPPAAQLMNDASDHLLRSKERQPVTRSLSLGAMTSPVGSYEKNHFISVAGKHIDNISSPILSKKSDEKSLATTATPTTNAQATEIDASSTHPQESLSDNAQLHQPDNIDGIPLVGYPRYRFEFKELSPLGRGGFGTVFRCKNALDSREYAIKKIRIKSQLDLEGKVTKHFSQKLHRVLREVKILAVLDHPNIVRYYTAWLEVDDGSKNEDEETNITHSTVDRKTSGFFSGSIFGFGSTSKNTYQTYSPKRPIQQRSTAGLFGSYVTKTNPLGWNNFGSFRLDESKSERGISEDNREKSIEEDIGFTWERSNDITADQSFAGVKQSPSDLIKEVVDEEKSGSESSADLSSVDEEESANDDSSICSESDRDAVSEVKKEVTVVEPEKDEQALKTDVAIEGRHILFIQMQLCSARTLEDFLRNHDERIGSMSPSVSQANEYAVDIPFALRLFKQISNGVKYVHKQGLIHRDLKPQNCFIDESGNVKVGDFGLSRENSNAPGAITDDDSVQGEEDDATVDANVIDAENTAGVGTRAYASPEQMRGSKYDASTDIYSLGIMLFELCYPMYTAMERYKRFDDIKKGEFPAYWISSVQNSFPRMHNLLVSMLSESASQRPSADAVFDEIDSLLGEYSVQSLDKAWGKKGAILLRVEAEDRPGILSDAMRLIKDAAPSATILQYGLRGQASKAIIEFALDAPNKEGIAEKITSVLAKNDMSVRQIFAT